MNIYVILPAYNESVRVVKTLKEILEISDLQVIVVDDGSIDDTYFQLESKFRKSSRVILLRNIVNLGKGATMKIGIEYAIVNNADAFIFIDADGQHNPKHLKTFENLLKNHDMVFGYRDLDKRMPFIRRYGNIFAKWLIKKIFKIDRRDLLCGYLAFKAGVYNKIIWRSNGYEVETEIAIRAVKNKIEFYETKIDTIYMNKYKGVTVLDAFKTLLKIPFWYFSK